MSRRNVVNTAKVIRNTHPTAGSTETLNHHESLKISNSIVVFCYNLSLQAMTHRKLNRVDLTSSLSYLTSFILFLLFEPYLYFKILSYIIVYNES